VIYVLQPDGRFGFLMSPTISKEDVGSILAFDIDDEGWTLVTCQVIQIDGQVFQMFYLPNPKLPINERASRIDQACGGDGDVRGTVVLLSGPHMLDDSTMQEFSERWGTA
jgi:hypothetical protein